METPYLILGIGNVLLTDDGVGIHAVRLLEKDPPPKTRIVDGGTDLLSVAPFLEQCSKALVIDAMDAGEWPGTLCRCMAIDLANPGQRHSLHELGLLSVMEFIEHDHRPELHILGVQPARITFGMELSQEVSAVMPQIVKAARSIIAGF